MASAGQLIDQRPPADALSNLFEQVPGDYGAHGRFDNCVTDTAWMMVTDRHRTAFWAGAAGIIGLFGLHPLVNKEKF